MNKSLEGTLDRDTVSRLLDEPQRWRIEWCTGSRRESVQSGFGSKLPEGVLDSIPTKARLRKIARGPVDHQTWIFARFEGEGDDRVLALHEGPYTVGWGPLPGRG